MKKFVTPGRILCLVMAIVFAVLAVWAYRTDIQTDTAEALLVSKQKSGVGALDANPVTQTFVPSENGLSAIEVMFSNYKKKVRSGTLTLVLTDEAGQVVAQKTWEASELKDSAFFTLELDAMQANSAGKVYTLTATGDCTEQKGITLRMGPAKEPSEKTVLTLADGTASTENALNLRMVFTKVTYGWMPGLTLAMIAACFLICLPLAGRKEKRREH